MKKCLKHSFILSKPGAPCRKCGVLGQPELFKEEKPKHTHEFVAQKSGVKTCRCGAFRHKEGVEPIIEIRHLEGSLTLDPGGEGEDYILQKGRTSAWITVDGISVWISRWPSGTVRVHLYRKGCEAKENAIDTAEAIQ